MENNMEMFICECGSLDHTYTFWYDPECGEVHFMPRLYQHKNVWQRIWRALGYIVGKKSRFGDYDSIIVNPDNIDKIRKYLDTSLYINFLFNHPKIKNSGMKLFDNTDMLGKWLISPTSDGSRMIDKTEEIIIDEIDKMWALSTWRK